MSVLLAQLLRIAANCPDVRQAGPLMEKAADRIEKYRRELNTRTFLMGEDGRMMASLLERKQELETERDALRAECKRLAEALDRQSVITGDYIARCQRLADELAITRRVIDRIGQICTTPHESKERFIRRVQSVIEWERAAQQDQPQ